MNDIKEYLTFYLTLSCVIVISFALLVNMVVDRMHYFVVTNHKRCYLKIVSFSDDNNAIGGDLKTFFIIVKVKANVSSIRYYHALINNTVA